MRVFVAGVTGAIRSMPLALLAWITVAWSALFAAVHFYWAGGGAALSNGGVTTAPAQAYIGFIAVLGLLGVLVGIGSWVPTVASAPTEWTAL